MSCRKCGCLILEGTVRCPMCNAKQRGSKANNTGNTEILIESGKTRSGLNGAVVAVISISAIAVFGFVLFDVADFDGINSTSIEDELVGNTNEDSERTEPSVSTEPPVLAEPTLWDYGSNELPFINQANMNTSLSNLMPTFITADAIYMTIGIGRVIRTTDNFENYEVVVDVTNDLEAGWIRSIHVIDDAIYYGTSFEGDLYRYDISTSQTTKIAADIWSEVIVDDLIFHQTTKENSRLYVLNIQTGERNVVINREIRSFVVDYENERIIFNDNTSALYKAYLNGSYQTRLHDNAWFFAFNGETIIVHVIGGGGSFEIQGIEMNDQNTLRQNTSFYNISFVSNISFAGNCILAQSRNNHLYLIDLDDLDNYWIIASDVAAFATLGNYIIYIQSDNNINRMDLSGQSEMFRSRWD